MCEIKLLVSILYCSHTYISMYNFYQNFQKIFYAGTTAEFNLENVRPGETDRKKRMT